MELKDFTNWLLTQNDPAKWLKLLDAYIQTLNKVGSATFVLPKDHEVLKGALESFANDQATFVEYLKAVRDMLDGGAKADVHGVYRTIMTRQLQATRRERLNRALSVYEKSHVLDTAGRQAYLRKIEQVWAAERMKYMEKHRVGKHRLSTDERNEILQEFWGIIDERISRGELPDG